METIEQTINDLKILLPKRRKYLHLQLFGKWFCATHESFTSHVRCCFVYLDVKYVAQFTRAVALKPVNYSRDVQLKNFRFHKTLWEEAFAN